MLCQPDVFTVGLGAVTANSITANKATVSAKDITIRKVMGKHVVLSSTAAAAEDSCDVAVHTAYVEKLQVCMRSTKMKSVQCMFKVRNCARGRQQYACRYVCTQSCSKQWLVGVVLAKLCANCPCDILWFSPLTSSLSPHERAVIGLWAAKLFVPSDLHACPACTSCCIRCKHSEAQSALAFWTPWQARRTL